MLKTTMLLCARLSRRKKRVNRCASVLSCAAGEISEPRKYSNNLKVDCMQACQSVKTQLAVTAENPVDLCAGLASLAQTLHCNERARRVPAQLLHATQRVNRRLRAGAHRARVRVRHLHAHDARIARRNCLNCVRATVLAASGGDGGSGRRGWPCSARAYAAVAKARSPWAMLPGAVGGINTTSSSSELTAAILAHSLPRTRCRHARSRCAIVLYNEHRACASPLTRAPTHPLCVVLCLVVT